METTNEFQTAVLKQLGQITALLTVLVERTEEQ
jgi:hypothetical protein